MHDLVLDFAVAQHSDDELCRQHVSVVDSFRAARPADTFGRHKFDKSLVLDPFCAYVHTEIESHVTEACRQVDSGRADDPRLSWVQDTPQDAIVISAGHSLGTSRLASLAEAAESSEDWWLAARFFSLLQIVTGEIQDFLTALTPSIKALDAIDKVLATDSSNAAHGDDMDEVLLRQLNFYLQSFPQDPRLNLIKHIQSSETRSRYPHDATTVSFIPACGVFARGDPKGFGIGIYDLLACELAVAARNHLDSSTRYNCLLMCFNFPMVKKRHFLRHFILKCIILPRQARDKHRESTQKRVAFPYRRGAAASCTQISRGISTAGHKAKC